MLLLLSLQARTRFVSLPALSYFDDGRLLTHTKPLITMIKRIAHVGVAVKDLGLSRELFSKLLGINAPRSEVVEEQQSTVTYFPLGESSLELIESTTDSSSLAKFIEKRGEGIHHICLEVDDITKEMQRLKGLGFQFTRDTPFDGGEHTIVAFIHPRSTNGVLVELSQKVGEM